MCCDSSCEHTQSDHTLRRGSSSAGTLSPLWRSGRSVVCVCWHSTPDDSARVRDWWFVCAWQADVYLAPLFLLLSFLHIPELWPLRLVPNQPRFLHLSHFTAVLRARVKVKQKNRQSQILRARQKKPRLSLKVKGHLRAVPAAFVLSVKCHIHVLGASVAPPERLGLWRWRVMTFPRQTSTFRRGHSAALTEFFTRKTHAWIIPLFMPPPPPTPPVQPGFVFPCVKLQLYRCPAGAAMLTDWHARGQPSTCVRHKDLSCLTTSCPAQNGSSVSQLALPASAAFRGRWKALSKMIGFLFQRGRGRTYVRGWRIPALAAQR